MVWVIILLVAVFIYIYVNNEIRKNVKFLMNIEEGFIFYEKIPSFKGYIVCVQKENIINELPLLRKIVRTIEEKEQCIVINLNETRNLDLKLIKKLKVESVPSIIRIIDPNKHEEIFNYKYLYHNNIIDTKSIISKIKKIID